MKKRGFQKKAGKKESPQHAKLAETQRAIDAAARRLDARNNVDFKYGRQRKKCS